jgi:hypothetical protein
MNFEKDKGYRAFVSDEEMGSYFAIFDKQSKKSSDDYLCIKYITLGGIVVKINNHVPELTPIIEIQWAYCFIDEVPSYDYALHVWKGDLKSLLTETAKDLGSISIYSKNNTGSSVNISLKNERISAYNAETKTHYYFQKSFSFDEIRQMSHIFVNVLTQMAKMSCRMLVHSAAVGVNGKGVLLSAKGGSGKSTLAVSALANGFHYVADDFTLLSRSDQGLLAHPIYSIVNLTPQMQAKISGLKATYVYDHWGHPWKQTLEISAYHDQFMKKMPLKAMIFPRITDTVTPTIERMPEKDKAIVQFAYSTATLLIRMQDRAEYMKNLMSFVSCLDVYQINLSPDLDKNVACLRQFIESC